MDSDVEIVVHAPLNRVRTARIARREIGPRRFM